MKVDGSLNSLIQGVSQQPARNRLPGQCTAQDNMSSNPVTSLTRRPPMEEIMKLFDDEDEAQFYDFDLGEGNQFVVAALPGDLKVFGMDGDEKTVTEVSDAFDYLDGGDLAFTTLDEVTYIANRTKTVELQATSKSYVTTGSLVYLLGGQYGRVYTVNIVWSGGTYTASFTAPDGGSASHSAQITTTNIATQLKTNLDAVSGLNTNFTINRVDDVLYIQKVSSPTTQDFNVTVADGDGGVNMLVVNNTVKDANKLPRFAPHGYVVTIKGTEADVDDWYVEFVADVDSAGNLPSLGAGFGRNGVWAECVAPATAYQFDLETMPHVLNYDEDTDSFTFSPGAWEDRAAGNENSNKNPTFVGRTIEDLAYFQGRLVMLSGPATIMSRTDKPYNFWKNSATILADSDRIDVQSTAKGVRKMIRAIPHNRDLVIFANKGQFLVFGRNAITPQNSALILTTAFEADMSANPVPAGRNIFFGFKFGRFTGIREFFTQDSQDANDTRPITQHVTKYLEGNVVSLTSTSNFDILIVQTTTGLKTLYVYEYTWLDEKKVQSSWSRWLMPDDVVHSFITESVVSLITKKGDNYILNKIDLDVLNDEGINYNIRLDRKLKFTGITTSIVAPYDVPQDDPEDLVFVQGDGCPQPGLRAWVDEYDAGTDTYTFDRSMEGGDVYCGIRYRSSYIPTNPDYKDNNGVKISTGKLKVSKFLVACKETGKIVTRVFSKYFADRTVEFTGRFVGDLNSVVGEPAVTDTTFIVPFREDVENAEIEFYTDSFLPMTITDIQWKGQLTKKGQRIANGGGT